MGDILGLIALLVLYIVASSTSKKKKNAAQKSEATASRKKASTSNSVRQNQEKISAAKTKKKSISDVKSMKPADTCQPVTPELSGLSFSDSAIQNKGSEKVNQDPQIESQGEQCAFANDIMRGVIMNEILMRPNEREIIRRMRQGR